jgi:hypothetical protein
MPTTYRLENPKGETLAEGDTIGYLRGVVRDLPPGRYIVNELSADASLSAPVHSARRWGVFFKLDGGDILTEPDGDEG